MRSLHSILLCCALCGTACAQQMSMLMGGSANTLPDNVMRHASSGTSLDPGAADAPMLMHMSPRGWMLMLHGNAFAVAQQQTGPRGGDKFFSVNWVMPMAQRSFGAQQLTLRAMLSLEPATITGRYYPELFQQGETAYGKPIVDGQHPHNFFMELAGIYDRRWSKAVLTLYGAPVGDPALGPVAYPHRASAGEDPLAALGHHLEDSTHISYDVVTAGITAGEKRGVRLEASGFHGREPDENRWHMQAGAVDSWASRITVTPGKNWIAQYSLGRLHSPEAVHPEEDVLRQTTSVSCHYGMKTALDATAVWGRNHTVGSARNAQALLLEGTVNLRAKQWLWARMEDVDRTSDLLGTAAPPQERVIGRVQAYTGGYARTSGRWNGLAAQVGAQLTGYSTPATLKGEYGAHPWGVAAFVRLQIGK